jgi:hypothetical protein
MIRTWRVTHTGWFLLCPVWLAGVDGPDIVPIPRPQWLGWWFDVMMWIQQAINWWICMVDPDAAGFLFHHVREVEPFDCDVICPDVPRF